MQKTAELLCGFFALGALSRRLGWRELFIHSPYLVAPTGPLRILESLLFPG